jgi:hypothetical protein
MIAVVKHDANWECYVTLNQRTFAGKYVVIAGGKLIGAGNDLGMLLRLSRKTHPSETPFVARVRDPRKVCVYRSR